MAADCETLDERHWCSVGTLELEDDEEEIRAVLLNATLTRCRVRLGNEREEFSIIGTGKFLYFLITVYRMKYE